MPVLSCPMFSMMRSEPFRFLLCFHFLDYPKCEKKIHPQTFLLVFQSIIKREARKKEIQPKSLIKCFVVLFCFPLFANRLFVGFSCHFESCHCDLSGSTLDSPFCLSLDFRDRCVVTVAACTTALKLRFLFWTFCSGWKMMT